MGMGDPQTQLGLLLLLSAAAGAGMGVVSTFIRFLRALFRPCSGMAPAPSSTQEGQSPGTPGGETQRERRIPFPASLVFFWLDLIMGLACFLCLILLLYYTNDGRFRLLGVVGMVGGGALWHVTLGRLLDRLTDALIPVLKRSATRLARLLLLPLRAAASRLDARLLSPLREKRRKAETARAEADTAAWYKAQTALARQGFGLCEDQPGNAADTADGHHGTKKKGRPRSKDPADTP